MEIFYGTWPWYISGPLIALVMMLLLLMGRKFGMSSNLRTICSICGAGEKARFFDFDWRAQRWNLIVIAGAGMGGFIAKTFLSDETAAVKIDPESVRDLNEYGFLSAGKAYLPPELFNFADSKSLVLLLTAGILIGFGTRYAAGCTSGHSISGLSALQLPSLIATVGFFIGGLIMIHFIFPLIF